METKAYFTVKMLKADGSQSTTAAVKELEAVPGVESVEPVTGVFDLLVKVDTPKGLEPLADEIRAKKWVKTLRTLKLEPLEPSPFIEEVSSMPGGESISGCIQCGVCSGSCPMVTNMEYSPRKLIALIRAGRRYDVLTSNTMWICASCYLCTVRCPQEVKITEIMHALESLADYHGLSNKRINTPVMYQAFVAELRRNGRVHELELMVRYYILNTVLSRSPSRISSSIKMAPLGLQLLSHRRLPLLPKRIKGHPELRAIIDKARSLEGY